MATPIDILKEKARRMRILSLKATTSAGSGHPSSCLSCADLAAVIFFQEMKYDPQNANSPLNDRFILSKGHAAPLLYAAFAEAGIVDESATMTLRDFNSDLEGHPTPRLDWVDVATGSLGQGLSAALGSVLAAKMDDIPYDTYVLLGDGECAEGSVWEAAALASFYKMNNLYAVVDVNGMGQSQRTMYEFDVDQYAERFRAFGWFATTVDGHDHEAIADAFKTCREEGADRPRAIVASTLKGKGVSLLEDKDDWHGKPIPENKLQEALEELGTPFASGDFLPSPRPIELTTTLNLNHESIAPELDITGDLGQEVATREAYGDALVKLADKDTRIVALDGDTKNSTFSQKLLENHPEQFFEMFIAEQNMIGVAAGLSARGKIPFVSTFAAFLTRGFDQIRMARISQANIRFVGSHCGVSIGPDGPSQMGLEDIAMFRAIPDSTVVYPCDAVSTERLVALLAYQAGISYIRTSRPKTPIIYGTEEVFEIGGSKTLRQSDQDRITIIGAGITLHEALKAYELLKTKGCPVRVIDCYSVKPIDKQGILQAAQETKGKLVVVEDHYWDGGLGDAVLNAVGNQAEVHKLAIRSVPRSGTPDELINAFGISANRIVEFVEQLT